jgi:exonuclease SbcD
MPKFLHAADLHLDSPLQGLDAHGDAPLERIRGATRRALERMVDLAIEERVQFVLIAGDVYDTQPLLSSALFFRKAMQRLVEKKIRVVIALGNHDHAGLAPRSLKLPEGVTVLPADRPDSVAVAEGVVVHGRSYPKRDCDENLAASYPEAAPAALNIGMLHTALGDSNHADYAPTSVAELVARGYQYWALGHVHGFREERQGGVHLVFPGNLQGRHARETGEKGVVVVEYERDRIVAVHRRFVDVVRWRHVEVDAATVTRDLATTVKERVLAATAADRAQRLLCAVRVSVAGVLPPTVRGVGAAELRDALRGELQEAGEDVWLEKVKVDLRRGEDDRVELDAQLEALAGTLVEDEAARRELAALVSEVRTQLRKTDPRLTRSDPRDPVRAERLVGDGATTTLDEARLLLSAAVELVREGLA